MPNFGKFVHLHLHSQYSLLDGACRFDKLTDRVKELGMGAVALTDHGNLFGALQFQKACQAGGVKPILGCEIYVSPSGRKDRTSAEARRNQHFVLLAESDEGYRNLARLTSIGYTEGFYYKPRIDKEVLAEHSAGLLGLSACLKGVVADYLMEDDVRAAERSLDDYLQIFGKEKFYIELMDHGIPEQKKVNDGLLALARKNDLPLVATNDCHYLLEGDYPTHDVLLCIQTGKTLGDEKRLRFDRNEFYMKTPEDMIGIFGHLNGAVENTLAIAERCNSKIPTGQRYLPRFTPPDGKTEEAYLREMTLAGLARRYNGAATAQHRDRIDFELKTIHAMGFDSYFLIVWDFIRYAKENGVPVGPGRGSGAGSLVAFSLGITDIDPLEHGLFFERFLNPERVSMPDFDIDFCPEGREKVIQYVRQKYGERNVAQIITFGSMKAKAALRDVGRVMGLAIPEVERVCKLVPDGPKVTLEKSIAENEELKSLIAGSETLRKLAETAKQIEGAVRHASTHAAGVVIADQDLSSLIPLYMAPQTTELVTQFTMNEVEEIGLLKMDFLGLKNLTIIDKTIKALAAKGTQVDWAKIPLDDPATYKLLQSGDAFGIFQLESQGMRELLKQLLPEKFSDVVALISLYRPGPMENIPEFIARKHGRKEISYDHPLLEPILKETYGLIVYQEQVMQIAQALGGFSLGGADVLRRAMGKKKADVMAAQREAFVRGCAKNKIPEHEADRIFKLIEKFAEYGFNKSHSAAYTMITFQTAYLKAHYPTEFMAQLLTSVIGAGDEKMAAYIAAANGMGIEILPPDINESGCTFTVVGKNIRFGLQAIKNVGEGAVLAFIEEREKNGRYKSPQDFLARQSPKTLNARMMECLIKCGAFDSFGFNRPSMLGALPRLMEMAGASRREAGEAQGSIFEMMSADAVASMHEEVRIAPMQDWSERERLEIEKSLAGYYLSGHPLRRFRQDIDAFSTVKSSQIKELAKGDKAAWVGLVRSMTIRVQSDGRPFALLTGEDAEGTLELTLFADAFAKHRASVAEGAVLWFSGQVNHWNDKVSLRIQDVKTTDELRRREIRRLTIEMPIGQVTEASLSELRGILERHKGRRPVTVVLRQNGDALAVEAGGGLGVTPCDALIDDLFQARFEKSLAYQLGDD